jgi:uncharacterized repeat protein (TIGR04076 family)
MKKWYEEDWRFEIEVLGVGKEDKPAECRIGLERGDKFACTYETPAGFCPTSYMKIFPCMEIVRCNGDLRELGGEGPTNIMLVCPDGAVTFKLTGVHNT